MKTPKPKKLTKFWGHDPVNWAKGLKSDNLQRSGLNRGLEANLCSLFRALPGKKK